MENRKSWREQLRSVEDRLQRYEADAQRRIRELAERGLAPRKELEELVAKVKSGELLAHASDLRARAEETGTQVLKRFGGLQEKAFVRMGEAAGPQIAELGVQVKDLSRKLERLSKQARSWGAGRAAGRDEGPNA